MNGSPFRAEEVARIAIALKGLPEFKDKPLDQLIPVACEFLWTCQDYIPIAERKYAHQKTKEAEADKEILPYEQVLKRVTNESKLDRAGKKFEQFYQALSQHKGSLPESWFTGFRSQLGHLGMAEDFPIGLENLKHGRGVTERTCDLLSQLYRWWKLEQKRLQRVRSLGREKS